MWYPVWGEEENMKANHLLAEMPVSKVFLQLAFPAAASRGCGSRIVKL